MSKNTKSITLIISAIIWILLNIALWPVGELTFLHNANENSGGLFPVFVSWIEANGSVSYGIIYYSYLKEFMAKHEKVSFLVPSDYKSRIGKLTRDAKIKASAIADGRQRIRLSYTPFDEEHNHHKDSRNISWYEATHQKIYPQKYLYYGQTAILVVAFNTMLLATVAFVLSRYLLKFILSHVGGSQAKRMAPESVR